MSRSRKAVQVHVGTPTDMGRRFVDAWHRAERGEKVAESHVTFLDVETMLATLSARRVELLRHLRRHGAGSVRELATALGRDYKNVHRDVTVLEAAGLIERDGTQLSTPWDEVQANVALN